GDAANQQSGENVQRAVFRKNNDSRTIWLNVCVIRRGNAESPFIRHMDRERHEWALLEFFANVCSHARVNVADLDNFVLQMPRRIEHTLALLCSSSAESINASDVLTDNQRVNVVRSFVGVNAFKIEKMSNHRIAVSDPDCAK